MARNRVRLKSMVLLISISSFLKLTYSDVILGHIAKAQHNNNIVPVRSRKMKGSFKMTCIKKHIGNTVVEFDRDAYAENVFGELENNMKRFQFFTDEYNALPADEKELLDAVCEAYEVKSLDDYQLAYNEASPSNMKSVYVLQRDDFKPLAVWPTSYGILIKNTLTETANMQSA